jgi:hypothetical protein
VSAEHLYLPSNARRVSSFNALASHLETYHGISRLAASERLHAIKQQVGLGGADVIFDRTGGVWHPINLELLGYLTEGGKA